MAEPTIAILGASSDRSKYGNKAVRAYLKQGYQVFPVNPKGGAIEGLTAYASLAEVPVDTLDRISIYLPPHVGLSLVDEIAKANAGEVWLNPGSESDDLIAALMDRGVHPIVACSIIDVGAMPSEFGQ